MSKNAWVTLATNDTYSLGALVVANSLKRVHTAHQLACLITPGVSEAMRNKLKDVYNIVQEVNIMDSQDSANLALLQRPELGITFTKLNCWRLIQFEKCVFLDADTLVLKNCDELFEREELSAAPDVSWPDCFNSGVFVYRPSLDTFGKIMDFAVQHGSFDGGDQGLLNQYYSDWASKDISKHLPFTYNTAAFASYVYLPAFKQFRDQIKILHFAGKLKPWLISFDSSSKQAHTPNDYSHASEFIQLWWNIFCEHVHSSLSSEMNYFAQLITDNNLALYVESIEFHDPWEDYYENLKKSFNLDDDSLSSDDDYSHESYKPEPGIEKYVKSDKKFKEKQFFQEVKNKILDLASNTFINIDKKKNDNKNNENLEKNKKKDSKNDKSNNKYDSKKDNSNISIPSSVNTEIVQSHKDNDNDNDNTNKSNISSGNGNDIYTNQSNTTFSSNKDNSSRTEYNSNKEEKLVEDASTDKEEEAGLAGALASLKLGEPRTPEQEAYEQHMRRQCWEVGQIDYTGKDSFANIWKKISETLSEGKPAAEEPKPATRLTSADIEDGKVEFDRSTNSTITYKHIPGGYEMHIVTPQPNGTKKTQVKTFYDPKPVPDDQMEDFNKKHKNMKGKTTVTHRKIANGREEVYTTVYEDGSSSTEVKTIFDQDVDENTIKKQQDKQTVAQKDIKQNKLVQQNQQVNQQTNQSKHQKTNVEENSEYSVKSEKKTEERRRVSSVTTSSSRTDSFDEETLQSMTEKKESKKKKPKALSGPPAPPEFVDKPGEKTIVVNQRKVPGGTEFIYSTSKKDGSTVTSTKTVYEEQEIEMTQEEIRQYQKQLREAQKHKDVTKTTKIASKDSEKKVIPSDRPGDVTTVETKKIQGGTEYHYTTVTAEGIVKKSSKTVYDPVPAADGDSSGEEVIEEYEEEVIEPGEPITRTFETTQKLSELSSTQKVSSTQSTMAVRSLLLVILTILTMTLMTWWL